jgi:hypothetical protein
MSGETAWHKEWKELFPSETREIRVGKHRADVKINDCVVEFQHSYLSEEDVHRREQCYQKMIWILDATQKDLNWVATESQDRTRFYVQGYFCDFINWNGCDSPIILHTGGTETIWVHKMDPKSRSGYGFGVYVQRHILIERFISGNFWRPLNNLYEVKSWS